MGYAANIQCVQDRINRFIGSSPFVATLSYHNFKIAETVTRKQS
jgi:hypothetical protein